MLFTGLGGKAFCAGGDVKALYEAKQKNDISDKKILDHFFREEYILDNAIRKMKPIQISAYEGIVMGGGVGLSIYSKVKIATVNTLFAMPGLHFSFNRFGTFRRPSPVNSFGNHLDRPSIKVNISHLIKSLICLMESIGSFLYVSLILNSVCQDTNSEDYRDGHSNEKSILQELDRLRLRPH